MIFISFDCDWDLDMLALPHVLREVRYPVTVFLIGKFVEAYPQIVETLPANPCIHIGNHTYSHPWSETWGWQRKFQKLSVAERQQEIAEGHRALKTHIGVDCRVFRSPHFLPVKRSDLRFLAGLGYTHDSSYLGPAKPYRTSAGVIEVPVQLVDGKALSNWEFRDNLDAFARLLEELFASGQNVNMYLDPRFFIAAAPGGQLALSPSGRRILELFARYQASIAAYESVAPAE